LRMRRNKRQPSLVLCGTNKGKGQGRDLQSSYMILRNKRCRTSDDSVGRNTNRRNSLLCPGISLSSGCTSAASGSIRRTDRQLLENHNSERNRHISIPTFRYPLHSPCPYQTHLQKSNDSQQHIRLMDLQNARAAISRSVVSKGK
jgi:hypothetical protein